MQRTLLFCQGETRHMLTREGRDAVGVRKKTVLYAAGVLACGNLALQALGFVYRVMLSRFAGA